MNEKLGRLVRPMTDTQLLGFVFEALETKSFDRSSWDALLRQFGASLLWEIPGELAALPLGKRIEYFCTRLELMDVPQCEHTRAVGPAPKLMTTFGTLLCSTCASASERDDFGILCALCGGRAKPGLVHELEISSGGDDRFRPYTVIFSACAGCHAEITADATGDAESA